jgi:hypothetical protein
MRTAGSTRAKCQGGRDVHSVYPAAPWMAPFSVPENGEVGTLATPGPAVLVLRIGVE